MKKVELGTVSHGTMRNEDLIPAFRELLEELDEDKEYVDLIADCKEIEESGDYDAEIAWIVLEELIDALYCFSPGYCYFGARIGDGSDYGYWANLESIEATIQDGELLSVSDLSDVPRGHNEFVVVTNDHGNMTLYEPVIEYREVWAIV